MGNGHGSMGERIERYIPVVLAPGAFKPVRSHKDGASFELRSRESVEIHSGAIGLVDTGVSVALPVGLCGLIQADFSQQVENNLMLMPGAPIDVRKRDSIVLTLRNLSADKSAMIDPGDLVGTLTLVPCIAQVACGRVDFFPPHLFAPPGMEPTTVDDEDADGLELSKLEADATSDDDEKQEPNVTVNGAVNGTVHTG